MKAFLWTMAILGAAEGIFTLVCLSMGHVPARTNSSMAINAAVLIAIALWAAYLLGAA